MEQPDLSTFTKSIEGAVANFGGRLTSIQSQLDAVETRLSGGGGAYAQPRGLKQILEEDEGFQRLVRDRRGRAVLTLEGDAVATALQRKTTITSPGVGYQQTGVLPIERVPAITTEPRAQLKVRDVLPASPTNFQVIDYVRVTTPPSIASPVAEASLKPENQVGFTSYSERVRTLATWIPATKQILDDWSELASYIQGALPYFVNLCEEVELLLGDGTGEHLRGILPQATAFNTGLLVPASGYTRIDVIARAIEQINNSNELDPTFVILNPKDWWALRLTKDAYGRYLLGDPQNIGDPNVFGLQVVWTPSMPVGTFVVGSGSPVASEIRDRMVMQVEISSEHADKLCSPLVQ